MWRVLNMRCNHRTRLSRKLRQGLESQGAAHSRNVGERLEDLRVALRGAVVEENHRADARVALRHDGGDDVCLGVGDVGRVGGRCLCTMLACILSAVSIRVEIRGREYTSKKRSIYSAETV